MKQKPPFETLASKSLPTLDDWHPSHARDTVRCSLTAFYPRLSRYSTRADKERSDSWRVGVWGADDTGMEQGFSTLVEAEAMYRDLPNPVTMKWLEEHGFKFA